MQNGAFAQPGGGQIYFQQVNKLKKQKNELLIKIYVEKGNEFALIDSTIINANEKKFTSLAKGKGNHKVVIINGSKTMVILLKNLVWGNDYGLLRIKFDEGTFQINDTTNERENINSKCQCFDLSRQLIKLSKK
jgi:hypothetical protein